MKNTEKLTGYTLDQILASAYLTRKYAKFLPKEFRPIKK